MSLHLLRYTWHGTSQQKIVLIRQYPLRIFHFFTAHMQVLKSFERSFVGQITPLNSNCVRALVGFD